MAGGRKVYRSMQGKTVDMELLAQKNELVPAIGNARMNARGDELGPGGKIVRRREDILATYYEHNPNAVKDEQYVKKSVPATPAIAETKSTEKKEVKNERKNKTDS
jgi:hypothetical protein